MVDMNYTDVVFLIDKSGSMGPMKNETITGFNQLIADQRKIAGKCRVSLFQFNDKVTTSFIGKDLADIVDLNDSTYVTGGWTAFYDALGQAIVKTGERFSGMAENERPGKVVFVVISDGRENSSKEYSLESLRCMVETQKNKYSWNFSFIGCDINGLADAKYLGLQVNSYNPTSKGTRSVYLATSCNLVNFRESDNHVYASTLTPEMAEERLRGTQ